MSTLLVVWASFVCEFPAVFAVDEEVSGSAWTVNPEEIRQQPGRQFMPAALTDAGVDEHLGAQIPVDLVFQNDRGEMIRLGDLFSGDKPVILSLNYSNCPMLCVLQLNGLVNSLREIDLVAGDDFRLVSVSLQPAESYGQAAETKAKYLDSYGKTANPAGWHFLVGNQSAITELANTVGIRYVYIPEKKEYSHPAVFCICMPDGKISRYHYGIEFPPATIRLSLVEASAGKIGTAFDRFLLLCFHYDESAGRYTPQAKVIMKIGGLFIILFLGILFRVCQQISKSRKLVPPTGTQPKLI